MIKPKRTWLFVPGTDERKMSKAAASAADALILDLEDAVAVSEKQRARAMIRAQLEQQSAERQIYVRVNDVTTGWTAEDVQAACVAGLAGIIVPKVEGAETIRTVSAFIDRAERAAGLPSGRIRLNAIIETARGVVQIASIAEGGGRLDTLMFGAADYTADLSIPTSNVGSHIVHAKIVTVVASRSAGLAAPIDTVFFDVKDQEGLAADCVQAKALGFQGKAVIHPNQIDCVNSSFTPSPLEIAAAQRVVETFREAERNGIGAVQLDGKLIDYAMLKAAEKTLAIAQVLQPS